MKLSSIAKMAGVVSGKGDGKGGVLREGIWDVLILDGDPKVASCVQDWAKGAAAGAVGAQRVEQIRVAGSIDAATLEMGRKPADVVFVNVHVGDQAGLEWVVVCKKKWPRTVVVALAKKSAGAKWGDMCLSAWRAGAANMLSAPLHAEEMYRVLGELSVKRGETDRLSRRNERLRVVCRRLNKARHEISQQVDLLCNDLVRAYQDMAQQLNTAQVAAEYGEAVRNEIEVEGILRKTMEWVLKKMGPVNAAVYLPSGDEHFALGAYLNLDTKGDGALIELLGRTIVEEARGGSGVLVVENDELLEGMFGEEASGLLGRSWVAVGCRTAKDCLAVLVVFKQGKEGAEVGRGIVEAISPVLAERMEVALELYQRMNGGEEEEGGEEEVGGTD